MSMFAVGGLSGWALGPILTTPVVALVGLHGTPIVALVPLAATALLLVNMRYLEGFRPTVESEHVARESMAPSDWPGFTIAATAGTLRSGALFGFQAFVPLYVWRTLDSSEGVGNIAIAAMLAAGALGTLVGGRMSDLHGFRRVVVFSLFVSAPLALLVPVVPLLALFPVLALFGLISEMNFYPIVVLAQRSLPRHVGLRLGRDAGSQHRPRLAREPAARRARRLDLAAHRARRGGDADGARRARVARAAAHGDMSAAFDDVLDSGPRRRGRARLRERNWRRARRSSRRSRATSTRACSRRSSASGSPGSTATRRTSGRPRSAASTSACRPARRAASRSRSRCPCWRRCASGASARALYIYPTKALAQDQARALREYGLGLRPAVYDGDTPREQRHLVRRFANPILTNPDMLHVGVLPNHRRWADVLSNLTHVVIDEAHTYRGVFGSHVALVLRRLRRVCALYGSEPQFLLASATIANPAEACAALTGLDVRVVDDDGAPRAPRRVAFWDTPLLDEAEGTRGSALGEAAGLLAALTARGLRTICFVKSRKASELVFRFARESLVAAGRDDVAERLAPYRAGYTAEERRRIEGDLDLGPAARRGRDRGARARRGRRAARLRARGRLPRHRREPAPAVGPRRAPRRGPRAARPRRRRARPLLHQPPRRAAGTARTRRRSSTRPTPRSASATCAPRRTSCRSYRATTSCSAPAR